MSADNDAAPTEQALKVLGSSGFALNRMVRTRDAFQGILDDHLRSSLEAELASFAKALDAIEQDASYPDSGELSQFLNAYRDAQRALINLPPRNAEQALRRLEVALLSDLGAHTAWLRELVADVRRFF